MFDPHTPSVPGFLLRPGGHDRDRLHEPVTPTSCRPARRSRGPIATVAVDDDLGWVVPLRATGAGSTRASSPAALVHLRVQLARELAVAAGATPEPVWADAELVDAAARVVADYLGDLPDLPFLGEPFGGEEGTD